MYTCLPEDSLILLLHYSSHGFINMKLHLMEGRKAQEAHSKRIRHMTTCSKTTLTVWLVGKSRHTVCRGDIQVVVIRLSAGMYLVLRLRGSRLITSPPISFSSSQLHFSSPPFISPFSSFAFFFYSF